MLINNENDMFLHTHLFNNTTKVNRAKRGAQRLILEGARPMQVRNLQRGPLTNGQMHLPPEGRGLQVSIPKEQVC